MQVHSAVHTINSLTLSASPKAEGASSAIPNDNIENFWGDDGFTFGDILDIVNPLQHLPVVSNIYQSITGDEQSNGSKMAGSALYGGFIGIIASFFDSTLELETGKNALAHVQDFGESMLASLSGEEIPLAKATEQLAQANTSTHQDIIAVLQHATQEASNLDHLSKTEAADVKAQIREKTYADIQAIISQNSLTAVSKEALSFWWQDWQLEKTLEIAGVNTPNESTTTLKDLALFSPAIAYKSPNNPTGIQLDISS